MRRAKKLPGEAVKVQLGSVAPGDLFIGWASYFHPNDPEYGVAHGGMRRVLSVEHYESTTLTLQPNAGQNGYLSSGQSGGDVWIVPAPAAGELLKFSTEQLEAELAHRALP